MPLLDHRSPLPRAVYIDYAATNRDMAQLTALSYLDRIRELRIDASKVTDKGYANIAKVKNLRRLRMAGDTVTDGVLRHIAGLKQLEEIFLSHFTKIKGAGLAHLQDLDELKHLEIGCADLTDGSGLARLGRLPKFRSLDIRIATINQSIIEGVCKLEQLEHLELSNVLLDGSVSGASFSSLKNLKRLALGGGFPKGNELVAKVLPHLLGHKKLLQLSVHIGHGDGDLMAFIGQIPNIEKLELGSSAIRDADLEHLRGLKKLKRIELACDTGLSNRGLEKFKETMPGLAGEIPEIDYRP